MNEFKQREYLAHALAMHVSSRLWHALDGAPDAYLMLSGGSTPIMLLQALKQVDLPWHRVHIGLADERWVGQDQAESNAALLHKHLLDGRAAAAKFHSLFTGHETVEEGLDALLNQGDRAGREWLWRAPDVLILGMGEDGHTASLFPDVPAVENLASADAQAPLAAIHTQASPLARMTFTGQILQRAVHTILHIHGAEKRRVLEQAPRQSLPIAAFLEQAHIWWAP